MSSLYRSLATMPQPQLYQTQTADQPQPQPQPQPVAQPQPQPQPVAQPQPQPHAMAQPQPQQHAMAQPPVAHQITPAQSTTGPTQKSLYKNRLQEYTQKAAIPLPVYHTTNEAPIGAPVFRSTVEVAGQSYTSPNTFSQRKAAELDAARVALEALPLKIREENAALVRKNSSLIREDTTFCKSILNEYAVKMHVNKPVYKTENSGGLLPSFVSSVLFDGKHYIGDKGRNKKESEQLAARAVILSILDSDACTLISEIIKSKRLLYAALDKVYSCSAQSDATPVGLQAGSGVAITSSNGKDLVVLNDNIPRTAIPEPWTGDPSNVLTKPESLHEFKIAKQENSHVEPIATPIIYVPPTSEQAVGSTSGKKRRRKNKKAKNNTGVDSQVQVDAGSSNQTSTCLAAQ